MKWREEIPRIATRKEIVKQIQDIANDEMKQLIHRIVNIDKYHSSCRFGGCWEYKISRTTYQKGYMSANEIYSIMYDQGIRYLDSINQSNRDKLRESFEADVLQIMEKYFRWIANNLSVDGHIPNKHVNDKITSLLNNLASERGVI